MPKNVRFWRNLTLIGVAHAAVITGLVQWSRESKGAAPQSVVWMSSSGGDEPASAKTPPRLDSHKTPEPISESAAESTPSPQTEPMLMAAKSEIQLPAASASPKATPILKPTPKIKVTPKPTPKPKPKPTATPKPRPSAKKLVLAKAQRIPKPRRAQPKDEGADAAKRQASDESIPPKSTSTQTAADPAGNSTAVSGGAGGARTGGGGGSESQFGWYGSMLHDRFYSEWAQPANIAAGAKNSVLVKIRIEKSGHVSSFEIARPSGNAELDQSVTAVGKRVTQVEALPDGLGTGEHYDVKISFELNSE